MLKRLFAALFCAAALAATAAEKNPSLPGELSREISYTSSRYQRGMLWRYRVWLPPALKTAKSKPALYMILELRPELMGNVFHAMMEEGVIPPGVVIFLRSGVLPPTRRGGAYRAMRAEYIDQVGRDFPDLLVEELIPEALKRAGAEIDPSPDMHFITGWSSGGAAAWNAAWFRNDYFRRVYLASPTFSAMRGAEEVPFLIRKCEPRPIRVYMTSGTREPDYYFGSSLYAALNAASGLEFAGYDFRYEQFKHEGHGPRLGDPWVWRRAMGFLWANWPDPVKALGPQIRIRRLVEDRSPWEEVKTVFPEKKPLTTSFGTYTFSGGKIFLERDGGKTEVASGFGHIAAIGISSDLWRLYIADSARRFIFAMSIMPDGKLDQLYRHAPLHLAHDCRVIGATDLDVLADDRVLAATELGVQGIVSYGLTDLILPLPGDLPAERLTVKDKWLYVSSGSRVFRRKLKVAAGDPSRMAAPSTPGYSDGFVYERSHLIP